MAFEDVRWDDYFRSSPSVILDVGAWNAHDAIAFKRKYPPASVYAFEAGIDNYNKCRIACRRAGVLLINAAVCDRDGEVSFVETAENHSSSGSLLKPTELCKQRYPFIIFKDPEMVNAVRVDSFCSLNKIAAVDLLHMDVQGSEKRVIEGIGPIRPYLIFAETCAFDEYESGTTKAEFDKMLNGLGYEIAAEHPHDTLYRYAR
jgi:FkbM family methyltransferase